MDISPHHQNINSVFNNTSYLIDFYQREYKWTEPQVKALLEDIFYRFDQDYEKNKTLDPSDTVVNTKYSWYYLSTYVTNKSGGNTYIVDGQQRLTTITLMLIKLFHLCIKDKSKLKDWVTQKILNHVGFEKKFFVGHEKRKDLLEKIYDNDDLSKIVLNNDSISLTNILDNYKYISKYLEKELNSKHRLETFIFYFLLRIVIVNLDVAQTDVPMVFEVINDRGERLKPYEILKGKLLGQIDKLEIDEQQLNDLWEKQISKIRNIKDDEVDNFFRTYLKARFADTRANGAKFDGDYHKIMFSEDMKKHLSVKRDVEGVKKFLKNDFVYYTNLYIKLKKLSENLNIAMPFVFYNSLTEMNTQYQAIMACCNINDEKEDDKISIVAYNIDRLYSLLRLQRAYDSNDFNDLIFLICNEIRNIDSEKISSIFNKFLLNHLSENKNTKITNSFNYTYFKGVGYDIQLKFLRYFFARVNQYIYENINENMPYNFKDIVTKTGKATGFHVEHILAENPENLKHFKDDNEIFESERNRLGGLLILKGKDNNSSNNEKYSKKLKTYANTIIWNESLREDTYKSKIDFRNFIKSSSLNFKPYDSFGQNELEERHKLLFEIIQIIWK